MRKVSQKDLDARCAGVHVVFEIVGIEAVGDRVHDRAVREDDGDRCRRRIRDGVRLDAALDPVAIDATPLDRLSLRMSPLRVAGRSPAFGTSVQASDP